MHICGADAHGSYPERTETGIIEELRLEDAARNPARSFSVFDLLLYDKCRREPNLSLHLNAHCYDVSVADGAITEVMAIQTNSQHPLRFRPRVVVDATGDAVISFLAGAPFRYGREARAEFGESLAPEAADRNVLGASLLFTATDLGAPTDFMPFDWARVFPDESALPHRPHSNPRAGYWWIEWGGNLDQTTDEPILRDELLRILLGLFDHIKNRGDHGAANLALEWVSTVVGKRESRRVEGDVILTQSDLEGPTVWPDCVAYGGWPIDLHPPEGIDSPDPPCLQVKLAEPYGIPLRALYSRGLTNLFVAGRPISVSHVAHGSTRVMATCAVVGQAAGTAAALAAREGVTARETVARVTEVQQQLLRDDAFLPGIVNSDQADLARTAHATATSKAWDATGPEMVLSGVSRRWGGKEHQWRSDPAAPLPQRLTLTLPRAVPLSEVRLTFDSYLEGMRVLSIEPSVRARELRGIPRTLVMDYRLELLWRGRTVHVEDVAGNYQRLRVHRVRPVTADTIELTVLRTHGDPSARVFEVRAY